MLHYTPWKILGGPGLINLKVRMAACGAFQREEDSLSAHDLKESSCCWWWGGVLGDAKDSEILGQETIQLNTEGP